jgi:hypothetical protein
MRILIDPRFWLATLLWTAAILATGYMRGVHVTQKEARLEAKKLALQAAEDLNLETEKTRNTEKALQLLLADRDRRHHEEKTKYEKTIDSLRGAVRTGDLRLRVAVKNCEAAAATDATSASGPGSEARAELMPETAAELISIAGEGDAAVRRANQCADLYEGVRRQIEAQEQ